MPKQKTHKGAAKRFKITANGKVMRGHANTSHMFTSKTTKRKRNLRKQTTVSSAFAKQIREMIQT